MNPGRIALLYLAPTLGALAYNCGLLETAVATAADRGTHWVLTPELCLCGYQFAGRIGTAWIAPCPDQWIDRVRQVAARRRIAVFLSHPERESHTGRLFNTVCVIDADGAIVGTHRKVQVIPHSEAGSSPGTAGAPIALPPIRVGILICADAYTPRLAARWKDQGAQLLVSAAAWGPWPHGPVGAWEQRSRETGLPLFVCNRTGTEDRISFREPESVVVKDGTRLLAFRGPDATLLLLDWDLRAHTLAGKGAEQI
jgi:N-carbamoylputrescine amidase